MVNIIDDSLRDLLKVELAFGADLNVDQTTWVWTDITPDLYAQSISVTWGRSNEQDTVGPSSFSFMVMNRQAKYTPGHPLSPYFPDLVESTPCRIRVDDLIRFTGQITSITPDWPDGDLAGSGITTANLDDPDANLGEPTATFTGSGVLHRLSQADNVDDAPTLWARQFDDLTIIRDYKLAGFWPLTDNVGASSGHTAAGPAGPMRHVQGNPPVFEGNALGGWLDPVTVMTGASTAAVRTRMSSTLAGDLANPRWAVDVAFKTTESVPRVQVEGTTSGTNVTFVLADIGGNVWEWRLNRHLDTPTTRVLATYDFSDLLDDQLHMVRVESSLSLFNLYVDEEIVASAAVSGDWSVSTGFTEAVGVGGGLSGEQTVGYVFAWIADLFVPPQVPRVVREVVNGFAGESATTRMRRIGEEIGVPVVTPVDDYPLVVDTFDRVEPDGWGAADTGQQWAYHDGTDDDILHLIVDTLGGEATPFTSAEGKINLSKIVIPLYSTIFMRWEVDDVVAGDTQLAINIRDNNLTDTDPNTGLIDVRARLANGSGNRLLMVRTRVGTSTSSTDVAFDQNTYPDAGASDTSYSLRVYVAPDGIKARWWITSDPEPDTWDVESESILPQVAPSPMTLGFTSGSVATFYVDEFTIHTQQPSVPMGPQSQGTALAVMEGAADADSGILYETREELGLTYRGRWGLYNQDPVIVLDAEQDYGEIAPPFSPVLDDSGRSNDITVSGVEGIQTRVTDEASIERYQRYSNSLSVNIDDENVLDQIAGWRLHLGTFEGLRYPNVAPQLNISPGMVDRWAPVTIGDKIRVTHLPVQHPTSEVELIVQGTTEIFENHRWDVTTNCTPGSLWDVGILDNEALGRLDTGGSELASSMTATDTMVLVATDHDGQLWVSDPAEFPFMVETGGEIMSVTSITGDMSPQMFTVVRSVNGIVKPHDAGTRISLERPLRMAL